MDTTLSTIAKLGSVGALAVAATVFIMRGDDRTSIDRKLDAIILRLDMMEAAQDRKVSIDRFELWIERARQVEGFSQLPTYPSVN